MPWTDPNFFDNTHPRSNEFNEAHDRLVPIYGNAPTAAGEVLRCVARITHEAFNNGGCNARSSSRRFYLNMIRVIEHFTNLDECELDCARDLLAQAKRHNGPDAKTIEAWNAVTCEALDWARLAEKAAKGCVA